jgi:hypothetical protein
MNVGGGLRYTNVVVCSFCYPAWTWTCVIQDKGTVGFTRRLVKNHTHTVYIRYFLRGLPNTRSYTASIKGSANPIYTTHRVGQNRIYTPYMTVYLVISLPKIPYIHRTYMVLANPNDTQRVLQIYTQDEAAKHAEHKC